MKLQTESSQILSIAMLASYLQMSMYKLCDTSIYRAYLADIRNVQCHHRYVADVY